MNWLLSFDEWVANHAAYPGLFLLFTGLLIGTVIVPEAIRLFAPHLTQQRIRELAAQRGDIRPGFWWDDEKVPANANFGFSVFAGNLGPSNAEVSETFTKVIKNRPRTIPASSSIKMRAIHTALATHGRVKISACNGHNKQFCYGFIRWKDIAGQWEHTFCVQMLEHPGPNEFHFTTVGGEVWNNVKPIKKS